MNPQDLENAQMQQAQLVSQAQQGLGTPPPPPFEYKENPSTALMNAHISKQQQALAAKMAAEQGAQGFAGYRGDQTAGVQTGGGMASVGSEQPNAGWTPSSPEAHNLNVQLADRIQSGNLDPRVAMLAIQHPDVSPEIKQALSQIVQQTQIAGSSPQQEAPAGLGAVGIPQ